jgi:hypothetical protein
MKLINLKVIHLRYVLFRCCLKTRCCTTHNRIFIEPQKDQTYVCSAMTHYMQSLLILFMFYSYFFLFTFKITALNLSALHNFIHIYYIDFIKSFSDAYCKGMISQCYMQGHVFHCTVLDTERGLMMARYVFLFNLCIFIERVCVFLLLSMYVYSYCSSMYS